MPMPMKKRPPTLQQLAATVDQRRQEQRSVDSRPVMHLLDEVAPHRPQKKPKTQRHIFRKLLFWLWLGTFILAGIFTFAEPFLYGLLGGEYINYTVYSHEMAQLRQRRLIFAAVNQIKWLSAGVSAMLFFGLVVKIGYDKLVK